MHASLVVDLAIVLGVAALTSPVARRLGQPTVLGYLVAGLVVGPYIPIPLFADHARVEGLAELGVVLVMFAVGLELRLSKLARVLPTAGLTGAVQVGFLVWCGWTVGHALGWTSVESLFLGAGLGISSTMVVSRALEGRVDAEVRQHVLAVLVVQDVIAIALVAAMTGVAQSGSVSAGDVTADLLQLVAVLLGMMILGLLVVPRGMRAVASLADDEVLVVAAVGVCFALAAVAAELGYSVALGAFVGGVLVAESGLGDRVTRLSEPMRDVFAGIFFVSIGMNVDPREAVATLPLAVALTALVIVAQLVVVTLAGLLSGLGVRRSVTAGLALGQIGEFAFILAAIGVSAGVVRGDLSALLVSVAVLTAFTTPLALRLANRVVGAVDRAMPGPLRRTLALHEQWIARVRDPAAAAAPVAAVRRSVRALALDAGLLLALVLGAAHGRDAAVPFLADATGLGAEGARALWLAASALLVLPVLVVAFRTTGVLARQLLSLGPAGASPSAARHRALRTLLLFGLTALVGFPAATVAGVSLSDGRGVFLVLGVFVVLGFVAMRSVRDVDAEVRSAAQALADALARGASAGASPNGSPPEAPPELPGLGALESVTLAAGSPACGRTLAELDLRARTGATVITIHRVGAPAVLPNGKERLREGDVLALAGTPAALAAARAALTEA